MLLYVLCNPLAVLRDRYTFQYFPIAFLYVPPPSFKAVVVKLYIPIHSYTFLYVPCIPLGKPLHHALKLYLPIRSVQPSQ
jgi:hypothetical protein